MRISEEKEDVASLLRPHGGMHGGAGRSGGDHAEWRKNHRCILWGGAGKTGAGRLFSKRRIRRGNDRKSMRAYTLSVIRSEC